MNETLILDPADGIFRVHFLNYHEALKGQLEVLAANPNLFLA